MALINLLLKIVGSFLIIVLSLVLIVVLANLGDEPLRPEVSKALVWQLPEHAFDDNGFLIVLGLDAPNDQDAYQAGKKVLEAQLLEYQTAQMTHQEPPIDLPQDSKLHKDWQTTLCDYKKEQNCVEFYLKQDVEQLKSFFESTKKLEERYAAIKGSKHYVEITHPVLNGFYLPDYRYLSYASELNRIKATLEIANGNLANGIALWRENALFSRRLLRESSNLVSRMIAIAFIQKDLRILSELISKYPQLAIQYSESFMPLLTPISTPEYSMKKELIFERNWGIALLSRHTNEILKSTSTDLSFWETKIAGLFQQTNAAVNLFYDWGTIRLQLAESNPQELDETQAKVYAQQIELLGFGVEPFYLKNPIVKTLLLVGEIDLYKGYIERQYDTGGHISLVALQVALAESKAFIPEQINKILPMFINPYTRKPMTFDENSHQIIFEGRQKSSISESPLYKIKIPVSH